MVFDCFGSYKGILIWNITLTDLQCCVSTVRERLELWLLDVQHSSAESVVGILKCSHKNHISTNSLDVELRQTVSFDAWLFET